MKKSVIKVFYTEKQVNTNANIIDAALSKSPLKPVLLMKALDVLRFGKNLDVDPNFFPFKDEDIRLAHTQNYVESFFKGDQPLCQSNLLPWSQELADSVRYTNASLYNAVRHAYLNPEQVTFSPTSGFHHAMPHRGDGFCTFSGQVIAAEKMYQEFGVSGAILDLDGHEGNSIDDARGYAKTIDLAIPHAYNFAQLQGSDGHYLNSLMDAMSKIEEAVLENKIHYVMWCHGADSHEDDDFGGQVDTDHWVKASEAFYSWVHQLDAKLIAMGRKPLPIILSLFGGYRADDYYSVLSLHIKDLSTCLNILCGENIVYDVNVKEKRPSILKRRTPEKWVDGMPISLLKALYPGKYGEEINTQGPPESGDCGF